MPRSVSNPEELAKQLAQAENDAVRRRALAKSITLVESMREDHQDQAQILLNSILVHTGKAKRIGISGTPGVGKSTFIEAFGLYLLSQGLRVAILAVDPSSPLRGGSILGDKTRMEKLAREANAFIRPSPTSGALGGVAQKTRESMLLCEAAGFDIVLVETVGVGQSEYEVASMVDFFMVLMQPNSGDELQGIKRGIMELADAIIVNKADGDSLKQAERTRQHYQNALHLLHNRDAWEAPALCCSSIENRGVEDVWHMLENYFEQALKTQSLSRKREQQMSDWLDRLIHQQLTHMFESHHEVRSAMPSLRKEVLSGERTPFDTARALISKFKS